MPVLSRLLRTSTHTKVRTTALETLTSSFPDLSVEPLIEVASNEKSPDRLIAIRFLGRRSGPDVERALYALTASTSPAVRDAARLALEQSRSRRGRPAERHRGPVARLRAALTGRIDVTGFRRMLREEELRGTPESARVGQVQARIMADAELNRRYHGVLLLMYGGFAVVLWLATALLLMLLRLALWGAAALLGVWLGVLALLVAGLLLALPGVNRLRDLRGIGPAVVAIQVAAAAVGIVLLVGGLTYIWWIWASLLLLVTVHLTIRTARRRSRPVPAALPVSSGSDPNPV